MTPSAPPVLVPGSRAALGVDHGLRGAVCLRAPGELPKFWACWAPRGREAFTVHGPAGAVVQPDLYQVGLLLAGFLLPLMPFPIISEQIFAKNSSSLALAGNRALLLRGMRRGGMPKPVAQPFAVDRAHPGQGWRAKVLGLPDRMAADAAENCAVRWAMGLAGSPGRAPLCWLPDAGLSLESQGALAEAGAIAEWPMEAP